MQKVSFSDCFMAGCSCMRRLDTCVSCTYMSYFRFFSVKLLSWQPYIFSVSKIVMYFLCLNFVYSSKCEQNFGAPDVLIAFQLKVFF